MSVFRAGIGSTLLVAVARLSSWLPGGALRTNAASDTPPPRAPASLPSSAPVGDDGTVEVAILWGAIRPDDIPVLYTCEAPDTFTAAELASAPEPEDVSPSILISSVTDPEETASYGGWRVVADDGERTLVIAARDDRSRASQRWPVYYVQLARASTGWTWQGEGDCKPSARFPETMAGGGFWRLDGRFPLPRPDSCALHIKVWDDRECRSSVEVRGEPIVEMTDDAVLVAIPVARTSVGDMCTPGRPTRLRVQLPEPLGNRDMYDIGALPLRLVGR